jgi:hypothetical protein
MLAVTRYLVIVALAGCFSDSQPATQQPVTTTYFVPAVAEKPKRTYEEVFAAMEQFRDKMCACREHDSTCAQHVADEMSQWSKEMANKLQAKQAHDVTSEEAQRMSEVTKEMSECSMKAMTPDNGNPCSP